jgi:hypothetical protein
MNVSFLWYWQFSIKKRGSLSFLFFLGLVPAILIGLIVALLLNQFVINS